ncbi:glutamate synthase subunit beta [Chitinibacter sp. ZOR0017]|uniref:glutamate synthase subunit beta n=1 Tax=Chitinibacter sp. ZOR0017 TaxID=1339254 RepID=UPI000645A616|nr:glutamate synthase subunit beta [Chitinibacter sp. ZOR0017]
MGKPTGFLEIERIKETYEPVAQRLTHYREFVPALDDAAAKLQGARCMDCGIPFCNNGCPVNNVIPDFNDLVYRQDWQNALTVLHSTNNFPEFTGRVCPAPCEAACTLGINAEPVGIKSIERAIIDKGWENGWIVPQPAAQATGKKVAIVGSGPAGLAAAQQLARVGHAVTVFEKNDQAGGLLRYGIPDFKLGQDVIDRRLAQLAAEGIVFKTNTVVGSGDIPAGIVNDATTVVTPAELNAEFDAVILAGGAEVPRDLPVAGRELKGIHYALELLIAQNKQVAGGAANPINAAGKHVVVIGGGDTGSDCVGTSNRHGAASVTQLELMPMPPESEDKPQVWPYWPVKLRTSSSHEEGVSRDFAVQTQGFVGENGQVKAVKLVKLDWASGKPEVVAGSEFDIPADLVFLAMGFTNPIASILDAFGVEKDARGNAKASTEGQGCYRTSVDKVFAAGDMRRGQSLVVWAIREGRQAAREVDAYLMGASSLPR